MLQTELIYYKYNIYFEHEYAPDEYRYEIKDLAVWIASKKLFCRSL